MDFFDSVNEMEKYLRQKCADSYMPFSGGLELTPECNMDCKFCYVHQNRKERQKTGRLLTAEEWCGIIDQAYDMGVYSLLITGGEPLLHPQFREIFAHAAGKGMPIVLNSNGTLMKEDDLEFFRQNGCRRFNISLYGADNETYEKLCGLPGGFDKVMRTLRMMKEKNMTVRISVSLTPQNIGQIDQINHIAEELGFPVQFASYMFPGSRRGITSQDQYRLTPAEAAAASVKCFHLKNPQADYEASCRFSLSRLISPQKYNHSRPGFVCYAGKSDFWLSWNGEMRPCGMFDNRNLAYNLLEHSFAECWEAMTTACRESSCVNEECRNCSKRDLCQVCPASSYAESGSMDGKPEYLCLLTDGIVQICRQAVSEAASPAPLVSVIIPVYNAAAYLKDAVEGILRQKFQSFELILVDDGSTDGSGDLCDHYAAADRRIRVIHQENRGVSAARNAGVRAARTKYILFNDSDDYAESDYLLELYHKAIQVGNETEKEAEKGVEIETEKEGTGPALIMSNVWAGNEHKPREITIHLDFPDPDHIPPEEAKKTVLFPYVWNKIYDRSLILQENIFFDESISYDEDTRFNEAYLSHCTRAVCIPAPLYIHLTRGGGLAEQGLARMGQTYDDIALIGTLQAVKK